MQVHNDADIALGDLFLIVGIAQESEGHAVGTEGGLDNVGDVMLVLFLIEVGHILAGSILMLGQVIVGTVGNTPKLAPAEGEEELKVGGCLGVEGKLLGLMVAQAEVLLGHAEAEQPVTAEAAPVGKPLQIGAGLAEELKLHLLKLTDAEDEVTRGDLVTEGLTDLADTEGHLLTGGALDVLEVDENTLSGLGTEVNGGGGVLVNALEGLEHEVELADVGEVALTAAGAGDALFADVVDHILVGHGLNDDVGDAVLGVVVLDELVGAVAHLTGLAVDEGIVEGGNVTGGYPNLGVHKDSGIKTHVVGVLLHELLPPGALDVVLELNAERTVVPGVGKTAVDLTACIDIAAALTEGYDFVHGFFGCFHHISLSVEK